ncbi:class F sortase [Saccharomonospora xinjiangensis]|uniref:class F sortase n=1 Tax=Saccharomonospora xinjiangensis TaxID=75294 RepID=UPI0018DED51A|nr:class F sortase [Saccharomonospora xinjiangensis]
MRDVTSRRSRHSVRRLAGTAALAFLLLLTGCGGPEQVSGHAEAAMEQVQADAPQESQPRPPALSPSPPSRLRIPSVGVDTDTFVELGLKPDNTMEVPEGAEAVGWYVESPTPGEPGPSVLAAHVDWKNQKGVFFDLRNLRRGDDVIVDRADGTSLRFRIDEVEQYPKDGFPTEKVYGDTTGAELRLITCGGTFDRSEASYRDNVVAYATMVPGG